MRTLSEALASITRTRLELVVARVTGLPAEPEETDNDLREALAVAVHSGKVSESWLKRVAA